jgi:hypothetical protein
MTITANRKAKKTSKKIATLKCSSYLEILQENSSLVEEPPAWHEAVLKKREEEWRTREIVSRSVEETFKNLRARSRGN